MRRIKKLSLKIRVTGALAIVVMLALATAALWPRPVRAEQFVGGPTVWVIPNVQVQFAWDTDVAWFGQVEVFDTPDATGTPVFVRQDEDALGNPIASTQHRVVFPVGAGGLTANARYFYKVTATDPMGTGQFSTSWYLPQFQFFTGPQAIASVRVTPGVQVEFTWTTDVAWFGEVAVFGNTYPPSVTPLFVLQDEDALGNPIASTQHTVVIAIGAGGLAANTYYGLQVTATDPTGSLPPISTPTPLPIFFTTTQGGGGWTGPSVRVSPNNSVEIRWITNFVGDPRVWVFDNPNGGMIIDGGFSAQCPCAWIDLSVGGVLRPDTTYYFRAIHVDPTNVRPDLTNDPAPYPPFFTGAQEIGDVRVVADTNNAIISWDANVIGLGRVEYASSSPGDAHVVDDRNNQPEHSMALTGLQPGTTYEYRVCNRHAFDGDCLAEETGSFTTPLVSSGTSVGCDSDALIAAIDSANDASGDILELSPGCTYTLNQPSIPAASGQVPVGLPAITRAIIIHGNGATIARGAMVPPPFRILQVDSTGTLVLDHLTVSGGDLTGDPSGSSGGGILNRGTLTITHSTISGNVADNSGGGINNVRGELTVDQSNISGNQAGLGGGIANEGNLTITQSTISDNVAQFAGGGIFNSRTVTVTQSTISGNASTNSGADYGGAAIYNDVHGELSVVLSTISGNVSQSGGGGVYNRGGTVAVTQSTIFGNEAASGGGIYDNGWASGIVNLSQSIIVGNLPGNCPSTPDITDGGYNLEDDTGCGFSQATSLSNTDPVLGPLQDNGGPTFTHALLPGSPAIDKGIRNGLDTDQRGPGFPGIWDDPNIPNAPGGDGADIGAFEAFNITPPPTPTPTPTPTPSPTPVFAAQVQLPIDADGSSIFNARRGVVPVKFRLACDGNPTCNLPPATIAVTRTAGGVIGDVNESVYSSQADSGPNFRRFDCQYHYNLNSAALGVGTYRVDILIDGHIVGSAVFRLR